MLFQYVIYSIKTDKTSLPPEDGSYVGILFRNGDKMAIGVNGELNNISQWKAEYETHAGKKVRVEIHNGKIEIK